MGEGSITAPGEGALRFTALSYNVHQCIGTDRRREPGRIVKVIRETGAQLIGLQEVDSRVGRGSPQMEYLSETLGLTAVPDPAIEHPGGYYGNVLLTDCPVLENRRADISVRGWEPRSIIDATLDMQGRPVRVVLTHLGLNPSERRFQVDRLIETVCEQTSGLVVVLADINEWFPLSSRLRSMHECLGKAPGPPTFPSRLPILALDRIWVRPRDALRDISVWKSPLARVASDHLPVKADILVP